MFSKIMTKKSTRSYSDNIDRLKQAITDADAVIIGAGAGLFQCSKPCCNEVYDNADIVRDMVLSQGYIIDNNGNLLKPDNVELKMSVPTELVPRCPHCNRPMTMNLRADDTLVEDEGWYIAAANPEAVYACVNLDEAEAPAEIARRAVCIEADIDSVLADLV